MKKILFITPHRIGRSPSQRFRFEQYLDYFKENGFDYKISFLLNKKDDRIFYSKGHLLNKAILFFKFMVVRFNDLIKARKYDIIFIQREAFFLGFPFFEYCFSKMNAKLIFDFDDSIWLQNVSDANKKFNWLKNYNKTSKIIGYADLVIAGNRYLANYALKYNKRIEIIPTTIDTQLYYSRNKNTNKKNVCIGWTGSTTTIQHFKLAINFLYILKKKYGEQISIKVIGDGNYYNEELNIIGIPWILSDETNQLQSFDIGIMPLPDDEWAEGKCGLKGLQYMNLEIPTIMTPVGVNSEIIEDGVNGFLATSDDEWVEKLSLLIENPLLREKLGKAGRKTIIDKYSVESQKDKYISLLNL